MIKDERLLVLFKLNPMVYIVNGFRSSVYEKPGSFSIFTVPHISGFYSDSVLYRDIDFKRLKVHFADVL